nr:extensin-like [Aegilops tauschii subsp. strangulata]
MSAPPPIPPLPTTTAPPPIPSTAPLALPTAPLGSNAGASTGQSPPPSMGPPPPPSTAPLVYSPAEMTGALNDLITAVQGIRLYLAGSYGPPPAIATGPAALPWYSAPAAPTGPRHHHWPLQPPPAAAPQWPQWLAPALAVSPTPPGSSPPPPW